MILLLWGRLSHLFSHWYVLEVGATSPVETIHEVPHRNASLEDKRPEPRSRLPAFSCPDNDPRKET
jgi:hypothetical protein